MTSLDVLIIGAFLLYVLAVGLRDRRYASASPEQYFLAGRTLNGCQAGISMAAIQFISVLAIGLALAAIPVWWRLGLRTS